MGEGIRIRGLVRSTKLGSASEGEALKSSDSFVVADSADAAMTGGRVNEEQGR